MDLTLSVDFTRYQLFFVFTFTKSLAQLTSNSSIVSYLSDFFFSFYFWKKEDFVFVDLRFEFWLNDK